jgi:hypothetical protein
LIPAYLIVGCKSKDSVNDSLLAKVYNEKLYLSEAKTVLHLGLNEIDSVQQIRNYVNSWVRKQILAKQVRNSVESKTGIDNLVKEYESSLLLDQFEKELLKEQLDSNINESEIINYFSENMDHFKLAEPIFRLRFVKMEATKPKIDQFFTWWKEDDKTKIADYCEKNASNYILDENIWHELGFINLLMPIGLFDESRLIAKKSFQNNYDSHEYFLYIVDKKDKNDFAPLEYVREDIIQIILQKRKLNLLSRWKEELFEKEFINDNVKIYL